MNLNDKLVSWIWEFFFDKFFVGMRWI